MTIQRMENVGIVVDDLSAVSHSLSTTSMPPSPACEPAARSSSASVERYEDSYRLCYVRGPEGIIVMPAEQIG